MMMYAKNKLFVIISLFVLGSCSLNKEYQSAISNNSLNNYYSFLNKYPSSKYTLDIQNRISIKKEFEDWQEAQNFNTEYSYNKYIQKYPIGQYTSIAINRSDNLKRQRIENENHIKEDEVWTQAIKSDVKFYYENYKRLYPNGRYIKQANDNISRLQYNESLNFSTPILPKQEVTIDPKEQKEWEKALKSKTITGYKNYLKIYPNGTYAEDAEKKIIDKEVENILAGAHGSLPAPQKTPFSNSLMSDTEVTIENNTKYNLTVLYSGPTSKKITLLPSATNKIILEPGKYKVAARVNVNNIRPFAGNHDLNAGEYSETFYIVTNTTRY